ncbi:MAG: hypothetical protein QM528_05775 [Phycisphaerales bacterium]|nr:hypothetical protein [Phycisphaerales bacterium]
MALTIQEDTTEQISLKDFIAYCDATIKSNEMDTLLACSKHLKMLSNNKTFLVAYLKTEIENNIESFQRNNLSNAQTLLLHLNAHYFLRVLLWHDTKTERGKKDWREVGVDDIILGHHDHDTSFMTVGYMGSGYETDIWEYDCHKTAGYIGEKVEMKFLEKTSLQNGKIMVYRAGRDIHTQYPPQEFSLTINLVLKSNHKFNYAAPMFDVQKREISQISINNYMINSLRYLMNIASLLKAEKLINILEQLSTVHPSHLIRLASLKLLVKMQPNNHKRIEQALKKDISFAVKHFAQSCLDVDA